MAGPVGHVSVGTAQPADSVWKCELVKTPARGEPRLCGEGPQLPAMGVQGRRPAPPRPSSGTRAHCEPRPVTAAGGTAAVEHGSCGSGTVTPCRQRTWRAWFPRTRG